MGLDPVTQNMRVREYLDQLVDTAKLLGGTADSTAFLEEAVKIARLETTMNEVRALTT